MKALLLHKANQYPEFTDYKMPEPASGERLVKINASALNHRDVWITQGKYPGISYPIILGSDGTGELDGKRVLINPSLNWGDDERFQGDDYSILGLPRHGTFAEYCRIPEENIHDVPVHLSDTEAAALPLAGLTAFRALVSKGNPGKNDRIFINGIGGGVALFTLQFAVASGLEVYVSSSSEEKIEQAMELGARGGINYMEEDWSKTLRKKVGAFDVLIDGAGGDGFQHLVNLCNPGARIVIYGGTQGKITQVIPQKIFWSQVSILGTTMGSSQDFEEMLQLVESHKIKPVVDRVFPMEEGKKAFERMHKGEQFGKIVLSF